MTFQRAELIDVLADKMTDAMDMESLLQYYYEGTVDFLSDLSDEDLVNEAEGWEIPVSEYGYQEDMFDEDNDFDDAGAYAAAGWGTDEDYGYASDLV